MPRSFDNLWRHEPRRTCNSQEISAFRELATGAKVRQLRGPIAMQQDIISLDVTVDDVFRVEVGDPGERLAHIHFHHGLRELIEFFEK